MDGIYNTLLSREHIRILTLAPSGDVDGALQCSLGQQHIEDPNKEYEAISYTWGDQERSEPLRCDEAVIHITPNLASALLCFRSRTTPRRLWADAVCINQSDPIEKGQQIPLMANIFRSATQVRVWLGKGEEGESRAVEDLASFARRPRPLKYRHYEPEENQALADIGISARKVFRMPWFGRRWIVQELVLNRDVMFHCGPSRISWPTLHSAYHALPTSVWNDELDVHIQRKIRQFGELWKTWSFGNASTIDHGIYSLLHSFSDLRCREVKDRIYAIAGLASDIELQSSTYSTTYGATLITPNFGISDKDVFQDLAFKMIQSGKVFTTLAHAGATKIAGEGEHFPSWIPDVRHPGSWPLIATEREAEFKLVEVCEPSNGSLTLKIEVYGCEYSKQSSARLTESSYNWTSGTVKKEYTGSRHLTRKLFEWRSISVEDVFEVPEDWMEHDVQSLVRSIREWLIDNQVLDRDKRPNFRRFDHLLWSLIRCQLLTEDSCESFDRLPSLQQLRVAIRTQRLDGQLAFYLTKALSARKVYVGVQRLHYLWKGTSRSFFGFGPHDLSSGDAILLPYTCLEGTNALFLRRAGSDYRVIGGGLAWDGLIKNAGSTSALLSLRLGVTIYEDPGSNPGLDELFSVRILPRVIELNLI